MSNENKKMAAQLQHFKHLSPSTFGGCPSEARTIPSTYERQKIIFNVGNGPSEARTIPSPFRKIKNGEGEARTFYFP
jgi:hypothetical protein